MNTNGILTVNDLINELQKFILNGNSYYASYRDGIKAELKKKIKNIDKVIKEVEKDKSLSEKYLKTLINLRNNFNILIKRD